MSLFSVSKQISDLIHDGDTDYDAPVKVVVQDSSGEDREFVITDVEYVLNVSDGEPTVWLSVVEE